MPTVPVLSAIEEDFEQKEVLSESSAPEVLDIGEKSRQMIFPSVSWHRGSKSDRLALF